MPDDQSLSKSDRRYTSKQMGDAGEMLVAAELTLAGVPAIKVPDNWPGYDVVAQPPGGERPVRISVKSRTYKRVRLSSSTTRRTPSIGSRSFFSNARAIVRGVFFCFRGNSPIARPAETGRGQRQTTNAIGAL